MTTVYVVTAGSGDTYRIERIFLDGGQASGFAQAYNGIAPVEPVHVEEWQTGARGAQSRGDWPLQRRGSRRPSGRRSPSSAPIWWLSSGNNFHYSCGRWK